MEIGPVFTRTLTRALAEAMDPRVVAPIPLDLADGGPKSVGEILDERQPRSIEDILARHARPGVVDAVGKHIPVGELHDQADPLRALTLRLGRSSGWRQNES
jgi:hypothetical protein